MKIKIVIADYQDVQQAEDILFLLEHYAQDPMGGGAPLSSYTKENLLSALSKVPQAFTLIGYADNTPVALANCFQSFSTFKCKPIVNIHDFVVLGDFRGKGISRLMLAEVEAIAKARGCCKITLEVLEGNTSARSAYAKYGFGGYELDPAAGKALFWEKTL
jgi:ribosomal protein S18 acetylase RimI-like enzyme